MNSFNISSNKKVQGGGVELISKAFFVNDLSDITGSLVNESLGACFTEACRDSITDGPTITAKTISARKVDKNVISDRLVLAELSFDNIMSDAKMKGATKLVLDMKRELNLEQTNGSTRVFRLKVYLADNNHRYPQVVRHLAKMFLTIPTIYSDRSCDYAEQSGWVVYQSPKRIKNLDNDRYPHTRLGIDRDSVVEVLNVNPLLGSHVQIHGFYQTLSDRFLTADKSSEGCFLSSFTLDRGSSNAPLDRPQDIELVRRGSDWSFTAQATLARIIQSATYHGIPNSTIIER